VYLGRSGQFALCRILNLVYDLVLLSAFVGYSIDVNRSSGLFELKLVSYLFALLRYLKEKLVVGTRC
jgi:hypothetical protein